MKNLLLILLLALIITLPTLSQSRTHTLRAGETLYSLARRYGVSLTTLLEINNISDASMLPQGITLIIPSTGQEALSVTSTTIASSSRTSRNTAVYYAKKGDTYYSIARNHGMKVDELLQLSSKNSNKPLLIGDRLVVFKQADSPQPTDHTKSLENTPINSSVVVSPTLVNNSSQQSTAQPSNRSLEQATINPPRARPSELAVIDGVTWPVNGVISNHNGRQRGVSIAINGEQSIKALSRGTVVYKGSYRELGQIIVIEHAGGYTYLYSGFDNAYVKIGDSVEAGTSLGKVSVNSNIIFSVFKDGNPINPKIAPRD